ncbi:porin [Comamonas sp. GB3 AK4-5]|uniref:porin n=1 Tax=Comamonas sp. GB3 AK4-5 TaxID=3231487 RepID=UPI00351F526A
MWKRTAAAIALVCLGTLAHAQSSVQIYGVLDTAVEYMNHVGESRSGLTRMPGLTGSVPSLLGFRGREDLGGGLSAGFTLEMGIAPDSGGLNQGGRGFGRQSFVSVQNAWGALGLGRQYTMLFWSSLDADVIGPNMHSMSGLDSYLANARADNAISYKGTFSGVTLGASYSFGRDTVDAGNPGGTNCPGESSTDAKACREWSAMLKYDAAAWGVALAYDELRGGPGAFAGLDSSDKRDKRAMLSGYALLGGTKIGAGYMRRKNDGDQTEPRSKLWFVGLSYPVGQWTFDAQYNLLSYQGSADKGQLVVLRSIYKLSKRTAVYGSLGYIKNSGNAAFGASNAQAGGTPMPGVNQTGFGMGLSHRF